MTNPFQNPDPRDSFGFRLSLAPWQNFAIYSPITHLCMYGGVGCGKTHTGARFVVEQVMSHPELTGFIGANTWDQLSGVALRLLFEALDEYGIEWVVDKMPPPEWGAFQRKFKKYSNILSMRHPITGTIVHAFLRVLAKGDNLRGLEFSWYWIDETRDTPMDTHDIILGRLREGDYVKGLITTTTNGKDWTFERFKRGADNKTYGCMHVPTLAAVNAGLLNQAYYDTLLRSYSMLLAQQELFAKHVNIKTGRAYYAGSENNRRNRAPWGEKYPNPDRPLIVGCDFNFSPAPCIFMVGQLGPSYHVGRSKRPRDYSQFIHWFGEIASVETPSREMIQSVITRYPGFQYAIYGDSSGGVATTSNAGETDYIQMAEVLRENGCLFSMDYDQRNPLVRDRVENMNAKFGNALGEIRQTYDYQACPNFDNDISTVGWKRSIQRGRGKLDDGGDVQRTHASDGAGYAVWKLLPPRKYGTFYEPSPNRASEFRNAV